MEEVGRENNVNSYKKSDTPKRELLVVATVASVEEGSYYDTPGNNAAIYDLPKTSLETRGQQKQVNPPTADEDYCDPPTPKPVNLASSSIKPVNLSSTKQVNLKDTSRIEPVNTEDYCEPPGTPKPLSEEGIYSVPPSTIKPVYPEPDSGFYNSPRTSTELYSTPKSVFSSRLTGSETCDSPKPSSSRLTGSPEGPVNLVTYDDLPKQNKTEELVNQEDYSDPPAPKPVNPTVQSKKQVDKLKSTAVYIKLQRPVDSKAKGLLTTQVNPVDSKAKGLLTTQVNPVDSKPQQHIEPVDTKGTSTGGKPVHHHPVTPVPIQLQPVPKSRSSHLGATPKVSPAVRVIKKFPLLSQHHVISEKSEEQPVDPNMAGIYDNPGCLKTGSPLQNFHFPDPPKEDLQVTRYNVVNVDRGSTDVYTRPAEHAKPVKTKHVTTRPVNTKPTADVYSKPAESKDVYARPAESDLLYKTPVNTAAGGTTNRLIPPQLPPRNTPQSSPRVSMNLSQSSPVQLRHHEEKDGRIMSMESMSCARCDDGFEPKAKIVNSNGELYHPQCFVCAQCFRPFPDGVFYEFEGRKYCEHDFHVLFAPCCGKCGEFIVGRVIKAMMATWHPQCFTCEMCHKELADLGFIKNQGRALCHECNAKVKAEGIGKYMCQKCHSVIDGEPLRFRGEVYHPYHFNCAGCSNELTSSAREVRTRPGYTANELNELYCLRCHDKMGIPICGACRRPIEERVVTALGKHWHVEHFVCAKCEKPFLGNRHYERKGLAYCETHYHQLFGNLCYVCNQVIQGDVFTALNKAWCVNHFACSSCDQKMTVKTKFYEVDLKPVCKKCYDRYPRELRLRLKKYHENEAARDQGTVAK